MQQARPLSESQETCPQTACMTSGKSLEELKHALLIHKNGANPNSFTEHCTAKSSLGFQVLMELSNDTGM